MHQRKGAMPKNVGRHIIKRLVPVVVLWLYALQAYSQAAFISGLPADNVFCISDPSAFLMGHSPGGKPFSGPGITDNGNGTALFNPASAGIGTHNIVYHAGGAKNVTETVTVYDIPTVTFSALSSVCEDVPTFALSGGSPAGGTYSGLGVDGSGNFNPAMAGQGTHTITYTVTIGTCTDSENQTITVYEVPTVTLANFAAVCEDASAFTLSGGSPGGGTYSGTGVTANTFNPAISGIGTFPITYVYSNGNCSSSATKDLIVSAVPSVSISGLATNYCQSDADVNIAGNPTDANGSFTGTGITDNGNGSAIFSPSSTGPGSFTITYTYSDANSCTNTTSQTVQVGTALTLTGLDPTYCDYDASVPIVATPGGGTFTALAGLTDNGDGTAILDPGVTGAGTYTIQYTYLDAQGCNENISQNIAIFTPPVVAFVGLNTSYCATDANTTLTGNFAPSGSFSGSGVTDNGDGTAIFAPSALATGSTYSVNYAFTHPTTGCAATTTQQTTINPLPTATITGSATICAGSSTNLDVTLTGTSPYDFTITTGTSSTTVTNHATSTYTASVTPLSTETYTISTVSDQTGCSNTGTGSAVVTVVPQVALTAQPQDQSVCPGSNTNFSVTASGSSLAYQWQKDGVDIAGETSSVLVINGATPADEASYRCMVSSSCGGPLTSNSATLTLYSNTTITQHPIDDYLCDGDNLNLSVTATGSNLAYQWKKDGVNLVDGANISGATSDILVVSNVTTANAGTYTVSVIGSCGTELSNPAQITIDPPITITLQPISQQSCPGDNISFTITATGSALSYQWQKDGADMAGATSQSLVINGVAASDAADYRCVISSACGQSVTSNTASLVVFDETVIAVHPTGSTVCSGDNFNFTISATGSSLSYQWYKNGVALADGGAVTGSTTNILILTGVTSTESGSYTCEVTGDCGTELSNPAVLAVDDQIAITAQPANDTVCTGGNAGFTTAATGSNLNYQWQKNGADLAGENNPALILNNAATSDAGDYRCVITNSCGETRYSQVASLTVYTAVNITSHPEDDTLCLGESVGFTVAATGDELQYQWYKDGSVLANSANITGVSTNSLFMTNLTPADNGTYVCQVTGVCGTLNSNPAELLVSDAITITAQPTDETICPGDNTTFSVTATGSDLSYQWQKNGVDIVGETSTTLALNAVAIADTGDYRCLLSNICGDTVWSNVATLKLYQTTAILTQPLDKVVCEGENVSLQVLAEGSNLTYQWEKNSVALADGGNISGTTTNTLALSSVTTTDAGVFSCTVTGECGSQSSNSATLTVKEQTTITQHPQGKTVCIADNAAFNVIATGTNLTYQWQKNGADMVGETGDWLIINAINASDTGDYRCVVTGDCGIQNSNAVLLAIHEPVAIAQQPTGLTVCEGANAAFALIAAGSGLTYQWKFEGTNLIDGGSLSGAITDNLNISAATTANAGIYTCDVTGTCGSVTSTSVELIVNDSITILSQPQSKAVCLSDNVSFNINASGTNLTYQWQKNGVDLAGETNDFISLTNVQLSDTGTYSCQITGTCGSIQSNGALLTVHEETTITAQPASLTTCKGKNVTMNTVASGSNITYQWSKDGTPLADNAYISGSSSALLDINPVQLSDAGLYNCEVTGACGTENSSASQLTVYDSIAITSQPANKTICEGGSTFFSVSATGENLAYQWQKDEVDIAGQTSAVLTLTNVLPADVGNYRCYISSSCGDIFSNAATLNIGEDVVIVAQPTGGAVCEGDNTSLTISATGTALNYQWQQNGIDLSDGAVFSGTNTSSLSLTGVSPTEAGIYACKVIGLCSSESSTSVQLTVNEQAVITVQPQNDTVCEGNHVLFALTATGTGLAYQWQKDGADIVGANNPTYEINNVTINDTAIYSCMVTGVCGSVSSNGARLTVEQLPVIVAQPADTLENCEGENVSMEVQASGSNLSYQWRFNGTDLSDGGSISGASTYKLSITNAQLAHAGVYTCYLTGSCGSLNSNIARVIINQATTIVQQPAAYNALLGSNATFKVTAEGDNLTYQWEKDGVTLTDGGSISGATTPTLTISSVSATDAAAYRCLVSGTCGSIYSNPASLTTFSSSIITQQPVDITRCEGETASFTVTATGTGLTYQWKKDGINLSDVGNINGVASATLTLSNIDTSNAGAYTCLVNSENSVPAVLTVNLNTIVDVHPVSIERCNGDIAVFSISATGSALTYQWQKDGLDITDGGAISGAQTHILSISGVTVTHIGTYHCVVTGTCTTANSDPATLVVHENTQITVQPVDTTLCEGNTASLGIEAVGSGLTYQWTKNGTTLTDGANISGANTAFLVISGIQLAHSGAYACLVSGTCGNPNSTSAQITVDTATAITLQPQGNTLCEGDNSTLAVVATGSNLSYQWQKNGTDITNGGIYSGTTTPNLLLNNVSASDAGTYTCNVMGTCDTLVTDPAVIEIGVNTSITTEPTGGTYCEGVPVALSVVALGTGLSYQWYKDGAALSDGAGIVGSQTANVSWTSVGLSDAGAYTCEVLGTCGTVNSSPATLTIHPTTTILAQPTSVDRCEGDNVSFGISVSGAGLSYQWQKDGVNLSNTPTITGVATSMLNINGVIAADDGVYRCIVTGICGTSNSNPATLNIWNPPSITAQPTGMTVCEGNAANFSITASGDNLSYQWMKNGVALSDGGNLSGSTTYQLQLSSASTADAGNYTCMVTGTCGTENSTVATLVVDTLTQIQVQPSLVAACQGEDIVFTVDGMGTGVTYQWQKDGAALSDGGNISGTTTYKLSINTVTTANQGTYRCLVSGNCGNELSSPVLLEISDYTSLTLQPTDVEVCEGEFFSLSTAATGGSLTYQWKMNGQPLSDTGNYSGSNQTTLQVSSATTGYSGVYSCEVSGTCGSETSSPALVTVNQNTVVQVQPTNIETCTGEVAIFPVSASGTGLAYQWQKNGTNLSDGGNVQGALTSVLSLSSVSVSDAGTYRCVVSGTCGTQNSDPALLTVNEYPEAAGTISGTSTVCAGTSGVYYQVDAINHADSYVWTLPAGMTIASGDGTRMIGVDFSLNDAGGNITVYGVNACGSGTVSPGFAVQVNPVPDANAGSDQYLCADNTVLAAQDPGMANGQWEVLNGAAIVQDKLQYNSAMTNLRNGENILTWTVSQSGCSNTDTVIIHNNLVEADAGIDQTICAGTITLQGDTLTTGASGNWSAVSGTATFTDGSSPTTQASGFSPGLNILEWTVWKGGCSDVDSITINSQRPTTSDAGIDQLLCSDSSQLSAAIPTIGVGKWNVIAGSATFEEPLNYQTKVTNLSMGSNILRWTITNGICSSIDEVTLTNNMLSVNAGEDQVVCDRTTDLDADAVLAGTGTWSVISGSAVFVNSSLNNTRVTGLSKGENVLRWIVDNNGCLSSDSVSITNDSPTTADAGSDQTVMTNSATLQANIPTVGTGKWVLISGSAVFADETLYNTTVSDLGLGENTFRWIISKNACTSTDDVIITNYMSTSTDAGSDQTLCTDITELDASEPSFGFGEWSVIKGAATFTDNSKHNTTVTNLGTGENILRWTVWENGYTSDDVVITNNTPTTANAGSDRTLCADSLVLAANAPLVGAGAWSVVGGAGHFGDTASASSYVTGLAKGQNSFKWTITYKGCTSSDMVFVTNNLPTEAIAGNDAVLCTDSIELSPNTPTVGVGEWSVESGAAIFEDNLAKNLAQGDNILRWTISNNGCSSYDELMVTNNKPTTAQAGTNKTVCDSVYTLSANTPAVGSGLWTVRSGSATFEDNTQANSEITGIAMGDNIFRWTITYKGCVSSDEVTLKNANEPATAGNGQTLCSTTTLLEANTPVYGTGRWSVVGGSGAAMFENPNAADTRVSGLDKGDNILRWTISYDICTSTSEVTITNNMPSTSFAGPDQDLCTDTAFLQGNVPAIGTGTWSILGGSGTVVNANAATSMVTELANGSNTLRWTIGNEGCSSTDEVVLNNNAPTTSYAGSDQSLCTDTTMLYGNRPSYGMGEWSIVSGSGYITVSTDNNSSMTNLGLGDNVLRWRITNGICTSSDEVTISNDTPTEASAGADQTICSDSARLYANAPIAGTGQWSLVNGSGTFGDIYNPATSIQGLNAGENILRWTITNNLCESYDNVTLYNQVMVKANAGVDMSVCGNTAELFANDPQMGKGVWSVLSGSGTFSDSTLYNAMVSNLTFGQNILQWTIHFGDCASSDNVIVQNDKTEISAGVDQVVSTSTTTLVGNNPGGGTGQWSVIAGAGDFVEVSSPVTGVENLNSGLNTFRWSVTVNGCVSYDDVVVKYNVPPNASFVLNQSAGCPPLEVYLVNNSINELPAVWNFGDGESSSDVSVRHVYTEPGNYTVTLTVYGNAGEQIEKDTLIVVYDVPEASFQLASEEVFIPDQEAVFINTSTGATDYLWDFGDGQTSTDPDPYHTYAAEGEYDVTLTVWSENECSDTTLLYAAVTVTESGGLTFPNAFTPNTSGPTGGTYSINDYSNDVFFPKGEGVDAYHLEIFNKWGTLLFESYDLSIGWDGYYNDALVDEGVYMWKVSAKLNNGKEIKKIGTILLIHK